MEKILWTTILAQTRKFRIEWIDIDFDNGNQAQFEIVSFHDEGKGVMILPLEQEWWSRYVTMIEHFCVGTEQKMLLLPWGYWEPGLSLEEIANKELQEEIGMKAQEIKQLTTISLMPSYMRWTTILCQATHLSPSHLQGDELESLTVHRFLYADALRMIDDGRISDARTMVGLLYGQSLVW